MEMTKTEIEKLRKYQGEIRAVKALGEEIGFDHLMNLASALNPHENCFFPVLPSDINPKVLEHFKAGRYAMQKNMNVAMGMNLPPEAEKEIHAYAFTFGSGHYDDVMERNLHNRYVKIIVYGDGSSEDYNRARQIMCDRFGAKWSSQYEWKPTFEDKWPCEITLHDTYDEREGKWENLSEL